MINNRKHEAEKVRKASSMTKRVAFFKTDEDNVRQFKKGLERHVPKDFDASIVLGM